MIAVLDLPLLLAKMSRAVLLGRVRMLLERAVQMSASKRIAIMIRDKSARTDGQRISDLLALSQLIQGSGVRTIVNGRADLAQVCRASAVQLPERGLPLSAVSNAYPNLLLGRSCHDGTGLVEAEAQGARWATLAPIFRPISQPAGKNDPMGVENFRRLVKGVSIPVFALGGITLSNSLKMPRVATIGALLLTERPAEVLQKMLEGRRPI